MTFLKIPIVSWWKCLWRQRKNTFHFASIPKLPRVWYMTTIWSGKIFREAAHSNRRCPTKQNTAASTPAKDIFMTTVNFALQVLNLKELGEVWSMNIVKSVNDAKYEPASYFQDEYPIVSRKITFTIPNTIDVELKEFNFAGNAIVKSETTSGSNRVVTFTVSNLGPIQDVGYKPGIQHHAPHVLILVKSLKYGSRNKKPAFLYWWFVFMVSKSIPIPEPKTWSL